MSKVFQCAVVGWSKELGAADRRQSKCEIIGCVRPPCAHPVTPVTSGQQWQQWQFMSHARPHPAPGTGWHLPWWAVRHVRHNTGWPQTWINYPPECSVQMTPGHSVHCGLHHVLLSTRLSFIQLNTFKTSSWVDGYNLHNIIFYVRYLPCLRFLVKNFSENCKMPKFHGASAWPEMDPGHSGAAP